MGLSHSFVRRHRGPKMRERTRRWTQSTARCLPAIGVGNRAVLVVGVGSGLGDGGISVALGLMCDSGGGGVLEAHKELIFVDGHILVAQCMMNPSRFMMNR